MKTSNGCWTCRLRRKKCDEARPICGTCAALHITCHYSETKPEWMDGGTRQEEMVQQLKREVKENAPHRRVDSSARISSERISASEPGTVDPDTAATSSANSGARNTPAQCHNTLDQIMNLRLDEEPEVTPSIVTKQWSSSLGWSDTILLSFYIEHVFPFLFPFHNPCPLQGGKAWILRLITSSPVVRQAMLSQSAYFLSLSRGPGPVDGDSLWETVLEQTREAFEVLRQALQVIDGTDISQHLPGTVRILASIIQVLRFEIAVLSFGNCRAHLHAAMTLFRQLLEVAGASLPAVSFQVVLDLLKTSSIHTAIQYPLVPSAEQTAFQFTSSLLIVDDIIASTAIQERPVLYEYHHSLLKGANGSYPPINLEDVLGCQNWVLMQIGEIAALDAWKQELLRAGQLDNMEVIRLATVIKDSLEADLLRVDMNPVPPREVNGLLQVLTSYPHHDCSVGHDPWVTRVWAHAAHIYLFVVVSGWQPANNDVRHHVDEIIRILTTRISPPELLRTMVWPFCVAGCLADPAQESQFRRMALALQPATVFGTVRKALAIMENVWENRHVEDAATRDLATCFRSQGDLVLLV